MKSFELLVRDNPKLSGAEIMKLHLKEVEDDKIEREKSIKKELELIERINTKGLFMKGFFGFNQKFAWSFSNAQLVDKEIYVDVEKIIVFNEFPNKSSFTVNVEFRTFSKFSTFGFSVYDEILPSEFDRIKNMYLNTWNQI